jgi:hypothetical protein
MAVARCPKCGVEVGATWRWCLACGYDPDGSALRVRQAAIEGRQRQGGWLPVVIVLAGLLVGGLILWKTTPDDRDDTAATPVPSVEISHWERFTPASGAFQVDMPAQPAAQAVNETPTSAGQMVEDYMVDTGALHFRAMVFDTRLNGAPITDEPDSPVLTLFATELATTYEGRLEEPRKADIGRNLGNEFAVYDGMRGDLRAKAVLVGPYLYAVAVAGEDLPDSVVRHMFDSFQIPS